MCAKTSVAEMSRPKRIRPKCPWPKCPSTMVSGISGLNYTKLFTTLETEIKFQFSSSLWVSKLYVQNSISSYNTIQLLVAPNIKTYNIYEFF